MEGASAVACAVVTRTPDLSLSRRYFFSAVSSTIQVHSTTTGEAVSTLSASTGAAESEASSSPSSHSHSQAITSIIINPDNLFQLVTSSLDGTIKVWDYMDGVLLQTIDLAQPIFCLCAHASFKGYVFVAAGRSMKRAKKTGLSFQFLL
jgi:NET1-associated nuclear protein 1 (U3 small nucleolar RNA-associated protein 17)